MNNLLQCNQWQQIITPSNDPWHLSHPQRMAHLWLHLHGITVNVPAVIIIIIFCLATTMISFCGAGVCMTVLAAQEENTESSRYRRRNSVLSSVILGCQRRVLWMCRSSKFDIVIIIIWPEKKASLSKLPNNNAARWDTWRRRWMESPYPMHCLPFVRRHW